MYCMRCQKVWVECGIHCPSCQRIINKEIAERSQQLQKVIEKDLKE
jgi:hypothetical protein